MRLPVTGLRALAAVTVQGSHLQYESQRLPDASCSACNNTLLQRLRGRAVRAVRLHQNLPSTATLKVGDPEKPAVGCRDTCTQAGSTHELSASLARVCASAVLWKGLQSSSGEQGSQTCEALGEGPLK